jgi:hypothetical protein
LAAINEKENLLEKDEVKAGVINVPLKQKQAELGSYFSKEGSKAQRKSFKKEKTPSSVGVGVRGDCVEGRKDAKKHNRAIAMEMLLRRHGG